MGDMTLGSPKSAVSSLTISSAGTCIVLPVLAAINGFIGAKMLGIAGSYSSVSSCL
jgi:hypothetical protein